MLSKPNAGWMTIELKDDLSSIQFPVSYVQDPVWELLKLFLNLTTQDCDYQIPSICFDGESMDTVVTFLEFTTLVTTLKGLAETTIIYKDWQDILKEFMEDINQEGFLEDYFENFYDDDKESEEVVKALRNNLNDKIKKLKI